jgi:dsRNA-specific ribonuclease
MTFSSGINIEAVKTAIGIPNFQETELLEIALTHPSRIYEQPNLTQQQKDEQENKYRRLALLGDSILNTVLVDYLHQQYPLFTKGTISNEFKDKILSRKKASEFANKLNLKQLCLLGKSEQGNKQSQQDLFGEMFEALVGAIYLGFERDISRASNWLIEKFIKQAVEEILLDTKINIEQVYEDGVITIADAKLLQMKQEADELIAHDEILQQLLTWINQKALQANSSNLSYKADKVRAFYLALVRVLSFDFAKGFDNPNRRRTDARTFALNFKRARELALDIAFAFNTKNVLLCLLALDIEPQLQKAMQELEAQLPLPDEEAKKFDDWRRENGQTWVNKINNLIGHGFQFNEQQTRLIKDYYKANKLLVDELNSGCEVSPEVRQEIEDTLLLPIAEIEKRQQRIS